MADIIIQGPHCRVTLTEPDEDGDYGWVADCGAFDDSYQPIADAIANAEQHVDNGNHAWGIR